MAHIHCKPPKKNTQLSLKTCVYFLFIQSEFPRCCEKRYRSNHKKELFTPKENKNNDDGCIVKVVV